MNLNDEIAKVAHELYEKSGRKHGRDLEHWLEAEKIVRARYEKMKKTGAEAEKPKKAVPAKTGAKKAAPAKAETATAAKTKKTK